MSEKDEGEGLEWRLPVAVPGMECRNDEVDDVMPYTFDPESEAGKRMITRGLRERLEAETEVWREWFKERGLGSPL